MASSSTDRSLLFGILALQMDFVSRDELIEAMNAWVLDKSKSLAQILVKEGFLEPDRRELLEALVREHVKQHRDDAQESLASLSSIGSAQKELEQIADADVQQSLAILSRDREDPDRDATETFSVGASTSEGQRFRVLRPYREGGLCTVSVALDEELHREVALKELKSFHADNSDSRARLLLEAEISGGLEHPGIVPVYGLGQYADGRPFYAMRLVRGDNLKDAIERFHKADKPGRDPGERSLEFRKLLGRFVDVCQALHYAHCRGVLHRDLKPGNIVLGKYGETLVVDWGLAKPVGRAESFSDTKETTLRPLSGSGSAPTEMGQTLGTPAFMSPEQAAGRWDQLGPASDVYSLGATLYYLLVGQPAFRGEDVGKVLTRVQEGDFSWPREVNRKVDRGLEAICLKAMGLKAEDRYASGSALAEDVEHWLADEPVSAQRETLGKWIARWMRHHRSWTLAGAAALLLVAVVSLAATFVVNKARQRASVLAANNKTLAETEHEARQEAVLLLRTAREAVDTWLATTSETLAGLEYDPRMQEARKRLLERAAEEYEQLATQRSDHVELETERGRIYLRLGDARRDLGESAEAKEAYRSAQLLFTELSQKDPELLHARVESANSSTKLGVLLAGTGEHGKADELYKSAISKLNELAGAYPEELYVRDALGASLLNRGVLVWETALRREGEEMLRRSIREFEALFEADPGEPRYWRELATARYVLANMLTRSGRDEEALALINEVIATCDTLVEEDSQNPEYLKTRANSRINLAGILRKLGHYSEELDAYRETVLDYDALSRAWPNVPLYRESLAFSQTDLGQLLRELGRTAEAEAELGRALPVFTQLATYYPEIPRHLEEQAACRDALGQVLSDLGRNEEAKSTCELAIETCQRLAETFPHVPQYRERLAVSRSHLGQVLHKLGENGTARQAYREAIETLEQLMEDAPDDPSYSNDLAFACMHLGNLLRETDDTVEADKALGRARRLWLDLATQSPRPVYPHNLARFLVNCTDPQFRDPELAIKSAKQAKGQAPKNAFFSGTLGAAYYRAEDWKAATETLREAIRLRGRGNAWDWFFLCMAQWRLGESEEATESYNHACQWMQENRPDNLELRRIHNEAAKLLRVRDQETPP